MTQFWFRSYHRAYQSQRLSLELARLNPRGSAARRAWLDAANCDASRKRLMWSYAHA